MTYKTKITDQEIIDACTNSDFMSEAAVKLGIHKTTLKSRARKLGVYNPGDHHTACSRGGKSSGGLNKFKLEDILNGQHPQYPTHLLSKRLVNEGILKYCCSICGIDKWQGGPISLELDHINGVRHDHTLTNLRLLCPNCHSQTDTYKSKNIKKEN